MSVLRCLVDCDVIARFQLSPKCEATAVSNIRQSLLQMTLDILQWMLRKEREGYVVEQMMLYIVEPLIRDTPR